jgi:hypothetical protein
MGEVFMASNSNLSLMLDWIKNSEIRNFANEK